MNLVLLSTIKGAPIAFLLMSQPIAQKRDCIFTVAARDVATYNSREGQVIFPGRPSEYRCSFQAGRIGTLIGFVNQHGWTFAIRLDAKGEGKWSARKDAGALSGRASAI